MNLLLGRRKARMRQMTKWRYLVPGIVVALGSLSACGDPNSPDTDSETHWGMPDAEAFDQDCESQPRPSGCEWALSTDAVVVGTVENLEPITSPVIMAHSDYDNDELFDDCDGPVNAGLAIELTVDEVLLGEALQEGKTVTVKIGFSQVQWWNPSPVVEMGGDLEWQSTSQDLGDELVEGMALGMGMRFHSDHDEWSLMGEPLFQISEEGLQFQDYRLECEQAPDEWDGYSVDDLREAIGQCESTDASDERRERMMNMWADPPHRSVAGVCIPVDE